MKHIYPIFFCALAWGAGAAQAACLVEYKAKRDNPLRLTAGVMQVSDCSNASSEVRARLHSQGWILLKVLSVKAASG